MTANHKEPTRFTLRWKKIGQTEDGRGSVQRYIVLPGLSLFDAWFDGRHLGQTHRLKSAREMVLDAAGES